MRGRGSARHVARARHAVLYSFGCVFALVVGATCDRKPDPVPPAAPKPPGTELSTVAGTSIKRLADGVKAEPVQNWTFNGLDAKAIELDDLVARTLPSDGWMGDATLPAGKYDVKLEISGKTPEEMRPVLFQAIESAFPIKLRLERKDVDGFVVRVAEGGAAKSLNKADPAETFAVEQNAKFYSFRGATMDNFADWAARELDKPVVNATELAGTYTFELPTPALSPASFTAAAKALRLDVTPQRLEQQVLVVEKAEAAK